MDDLNRPLRPPRERGRAPPLGDLSRHARGGRPDATGMLDTRFGGRPPWARLVGIALVALAVGGAWWLGRERAASDPSTVADAAAVAPLDRASVTAAIGPAVDRRTPAPSRGTARTDDAPDRSNGELAVLDRPVAPPLELGLPEPDDHPVHLPRHDLIEDAPEGPLPRRGEDGLTPFDAYRVPSRTPAAARVAIVIGGLGLSQTGTQLAIKELPAAVTLAFSPEGFSLRRWTEAARKDGHELALQVPLEGAGDVGGAGDADGAGGGGPRTLFADDPAPQRLHASLGRLTTYASVVNYEGGAFLSDAAATETLLRELDARGLAYLDDGTVRDGHAAAVAQEVGLPFAQGTIVLDAERGPAAVDRALERLVAEAKRTGRAIATGSAFPSTIERVALFAERAKARGVTIVPVSNLMRRR